MRLTNTIRDSVRAYLTRKAFPPEVEASLEKNLRIDIEGFEPLLERKKIYDQNPEFIIGSTSVNLVRLIKSSDTSSRIETDYKISTSFTFAVKPKEWHTYDLTVNDKMVEEKYPRLVEDYKKLLTFRSFKKDYNRRLKKLLDSLTSSSALIKLIPEAKEYFDSEHGGVGPNTAMLNKEDLDFIKSCLSGGNFNA